MDAVQKRNLVNFFHATKRKIIALYSYSYKIISSSTSGAGVLCLGTKVQPRKSLGSEKILDAPRPNLFDLRTGGQADNGWVPR